jgi:hypothetical protein
MTELIKKVLNDENFPSHPRLQIGMKDGKPEYRFHISQDSFYEQDGKVYAPFMNSDGKSMRYVFRYGKYNMDEVFARIGKERKGDFEHLIVATEFFPVDI